MLDGTKHYIDPEIVKNYNLVNVKESFFQGEKSIMRKVEPSHHIELNAFRLKIGQRNKH